MGDSKMHTKQKLSQLILAIIVITAITFSGLNPSLVFAQEGDGIRRQYNAESGKVSFIGPESGRSLSVQKALGTFIRPQDPAMALAKHFAPEFSVDDPERDLTKMETSHPGDERVTVRYQQTYQGVPVMGGELIVNTNEQGDLYSLNGEVSPDLSLQTQPEVASDKAQDTALVALAKWYQKTSADFVTTEPELWIYDESLLQPSTRPAELVWRMEVTAVEESLPVRELVLVDAHRGGISLHFNQVDAAWTGDHQKPTSNLQAGAPPWYVATTGDDTNNCTTHFIRPCKTINGAIGKAANGDTIFVTIGTYTNNNIYGRAIYIGKNIFLSGGWNSTFTSQLGYSIIDGQSSVTCIEIGGVNVTIDHLTVQNGNGNFGAQGGGISLKGGNLTLMNSIVKENQAPRSGGRIYIYGGNLTLSIVSS